MYSQNQEQKHILDFFKDTKGTLLSIGENDGKTFSNSLALIELGFSAVLVEPSPIAYKKLTELHKHRQSQVICINAAIGESVGKAILYESSHHLSDKSDVALLSSLKESETEKWKKSGVDFKEEEVDVITYKLVKTILDSETEFDFITIDAEGYDLEILKQIDLTSVKLLCIEWNSKKEIKNAILEYTSRFGMDNIIYESTENLLICKRQ